MEKKFIDGLFINKPSEKAPDFVKVKASISADKFIPFLKENVNGKGYLNFDILESRDGKYYAKIDTFEPKKETVEVENMRGEKDIVDINDLPF